MFSGFIHALTCVDTQKRFYRREERPVTSWNCSEVAK